MTDAIARKHRPVEADDDPYLPQLSAREMEEMALHAEFVPVSKVPSDFEAERDAELELQRMFDQDARDWDDMVERGVWY